MPARCPVTYFVYPSCFPTTFPSKLAYKLISLFNEVYKKLNSKNGGSFSSFFKLNNLYAICGSPERFLKLETIDVSKVLIDKKAPVGMQVDKGFSANPTKPVGGTPQPQKGVDFNQDKEKTVVYWFFSLFNRFFRLM